MTDPADTRVAVYIDFDNIVISRYNQLHGRTQFQQDRARNFDVSRAPAGSEIAARLVAATVDIDAILDYASSFGTIVLSRAYADWSASINAGYQGQLVERAVDLTQLFPTAAYTKNGADIRLAVDAVEEMFRLPDLTHVVIVAGDSDYIALAQRCKRLGRYVIGIGVAGSTSRSLAAACDEFADYDALPGVNVAPEITARDATEPVGPRGQAGAVATATSEAGAVESTRTAGPASDVVNGGRVAASTKSAPEQVPGAAPAAGDLEPVFSSLVTPLEAAGNLLVRALRLGHAKEEDAEWLFSSEVKKQMKRIDPSFNEKALGFRSFSDFIKSQPDIADLDETTTIRMLRLRSGFSRAS